MFTDSVEPGVRTTCVHKQSTWPQEQELPSTSRSLFVWLLPLLVLFAFSLLSALPNLFAPPSVADPRFSFEASTQFNLKRTTQTLGVQYHVNSAEFSRHPIAAEIARSGQSNGPQSMTALQHFEENVDQAFTQETYEMCQRGLDSKQQQMVQAYEREDWEMVKQIDAETVESCETLKQIGLVHLKPTMGASYADSLISFWLACLVRGLAFRTLHLIDTYSFALCNVAS